MRKLLFLIFLLGLLACSYLLASFSEKSNEISNHIIIIRTLVNFVASFVVLTAFVTFVTDYVPAVRVTTARNNPSKNLIYYKVENFSKTLIKNMVSHYVLFDIPIRDGANCTSNDLHLFLYNLSKEKSYVAPSSAQEFVLNLNRVKTDQLTKVRVTLDLFTHHIFLLVTLKFGFWFWPFKDFRIRGVLSFDKENNEWFGGSEEHPELERLFKELFADLENDDEMKLKGFLNETTQRAKDSWGELNKKGYSANF